MKKKELLSNTLLIIGIFIHIAAIILLYIGAIRFFNIGVVEAAVIFLIINFFALVVVYK